MNDNLNHLLINLLGIIVIAFGIFLLVRYAYRMVVSLRQNPLYRAYKEMKQTMRQAQEQMQQQADGTPGYNGQHTRIVPDDEGEYIEFEEIKEEET